MFQMYYGNMCISLKKYDEYKISKNILKTM
jgi:hypothetical protein